MTSIKENVKKASPLYEPKKHTLMFTVLGYERFLHFQFLTMKKNSLVLPIFIPCIPSASSKGMMNTVDFYEEFLCWVKKYNQNNRALHPNSSLFHLDDTLALFCYTGRIIDFLWMCFLSQSLGMPSFVLIPEAFAEFCKPKHSEELGFVETGSALSFASSPAKAVSFGYRMCLSGLNQLPWILPWYLGSNPLYFAFLYKISLGMFWK